MPRAASVAGVGGFRASPLSIFYQVAGSQSPQAADPMTRIVVLSRIGFAPVTPNQTLWANTDIMTQGWRIFWTTPGQYSFNVANGAGAAVTANLAFAPPVGQLFAMGMSYSGGTLVAASSTGLTATVASGVAGVTLGIRTISVGIRPNSLDEPARSHAVHALLASDTASLTLAALQAALDTVLGELADGNYITPAAGYDGYYLDARDVTQNPAQWRDRISGQLYTRTAGPANASSFYGVPGVYP